MRRLLLLISILSISISLSANDADKISFTLINTTKKSIPLMIPNVMNPNLSPFSESRVTLSIGQKILFKYKGKKRLLLVVTKENQGLTLDVAKLLKKKKKELKRQ
jgi:hypothetical protein